MTYDNTVNQEGTADRVPSNTAIQKTGREWRKVPPRQREEKPMTDTVAPSWKEVGAHSETREECLERAREVAAVHAEDAAERDRANEKPDAEVALLKESGLVTLMGPREHGGGGQTWVTAYRVIREIAEADGSIGEYLVVPESQRRGGVWTDYEGNTLRESIHEPGQKRLRDEHPGSRYRRLETREKTYVR